MSLRSLESAHEAPISRQSLHGAATERLRDMIIQNELAPGQRVPERQLCELLGISRTPLREALKVLAAEGLVELLPNRGSTVAPLTVDDLDRTIAVMAPLEYLAGELAAAHITDEQINEIRALHFEMLACHSRGQLPEYFRLNQAIHANLLAATDNAVLALVWRGLNGRIRRYRFMANLAQDRWDEAVKEHREILPALEARDGARLGELLKSHLLGMAGRLKNGLGELTLSERELSTH
jgi:DNA-binding GntR family transcriptional regulator